MISKNALLCSLPHQPEKQETYDPRRTQNAGHQQGKDIEGQHDSGKDTCQIYNTKSAKSPKGGSCHGSKSLSHTNYNNKNDESGNDESGHDW